ncbi:MAG TPA: hypothetical protein VMJ75_03380, partial [Candidatus Acidoferrales bacterium]|nr:hypothetical protein [Candidatus Acidoferrales bacterium]
MSADRQIVGIVRESAPGEQRVAMVPGALAVLNKTGCEFLMEAGAGLRAGFPDAEYIEKRARITESRAEVFASSDVLLQVRAPGANAETGADDVAQMHRGQVVIGFGEPLTAG